MLLKLSRKYKEIFIGEGSLKLLIPLQYHTLGEEKQEKLWWWIIVLSAEKQFYHGNNAALYWMTLNQLTDLSKAPVSTSVKVGKTVAAWLGYWED